jgi:signal transduction histidine kinase
VDQLIYSDDAPFFEAREITIEQGFWSGELRHQAKDGREIVIEGHWTLVRDGAGQPKSILAISTDITEKKKLEAQFFRAQRMESIGTLAGGIAHDLNNVLGPIIMAVDLLKLRLTDPRDYELLDLMDTSAQRGADMVKQVLHFARGIEGRRMLISPGQLVHELQRIARDTFPKSISIETDISAEAWKTSGDRTQIHQVLLNLCINARDAMPDGGRLRMSVHNLQVDEHYAAMHSDARARPLRRH